MSSPTTRAFLIPPQIVVQFHHNGLFYYKEWILDLSMPWKQYKANNNRNKSIGNHRIGTLIYIILYFVLYCICQSYVDISGKFYSVIAFHISKTKIWSWEFYMFSCSVFLSNEGYYLKCHVSVKYFTNTLSNLQKSHMI